MSFIKGLLFSALLAPVWAGPQLRAAEFEVLDRFSVDGYSVLRGSADIPGGGFSVGGSTFVVQYGKVGIGTAAPGAILHISSAGAASTQDFVRVSTGIPAGSDVFVIKGSGSIGIGTANPAANLEVAGEVKIGYAASTCSSAIAGTLRWYDGHMSVCNGSAWRQLDNQPPPTLTSITPASGLYTLQTAITISGTGFNLGLELLIGGAAATDIAVSATLITAKTPVGSVGTKDVKITNPDGQYVAGAFTYNPLPTVASVSPASGQTARTTNITLAGTGFLSGAGVTVGGVTATVNTVSATQITAIAPAIASSGAKNVTVTNPDTGAATLTGGFTCVPFAAGGSETDSGLYHIHTFNSGSTFTANFAGNVEVLVVAGGGGAGSFGGGGGAGGVIYNSAYPVTTAAPYTVTVGDGGNGYTTSDTGTPGWNGANSVFASLTAIGGGGGGSRGAAPVHASNPGSVGGSGGGASVGNTGSASAGAAGTPGQGNNGGAGHIQPAHTDGGGGGAGGVGGDATATTSGNGGVGLAYSISGTSTYYGGGGGGGGYTDVTAAGTGGAGGGGNGVTTGIGGNGAANTGGGGGGSGYQTAGGKGGSGIVIIRYLR